MENEENILHKEERKRKKNTKISCNCSCNRVTIVSERVARYLFRRGKEIRRCPTCGRVPHYEGTNRDITDNYISALKRIYK
jgi:hypothetical protein